MCFPPQIVLGFEQDSLSLSFRGSKGACVLCNPLYLLPWNQTTSNTHCISLALWFSPGCFSLFLSLILNSEEQLTGDPVWFLGIVYVWHLGQVGFQSPAVAAQAQYTKYPTKSSVCWTGIFFSPWKIEKGFWRIMKHLRAEKPRLLKEHLFLVVPGRWIL